MRQAPIAAVRNALNEKGAGGPVTIPEMLDAMETKAVADREKQSKDPILKLASRVYPEGELRAAGVRPFWCWHCLMILVSDCTCAPTALYLVQQCSVSCRPLHARGRPPRSGFARDFLQR